jgi:hypothetical protein
VAAGAVKEMAEPGLTAVVSLSVLTVKEDAAIEPGVDEFVMPLTTKETEVPEV